MCWFLKNIKREEQEKPGSKSPRPDPSKKEDKREEMNKIPENQEQNHWKKLNQ